MNQKKDSSLQVELSPEEIETAKEARRCYMRQYMRKRYADNPERQKNANLRYWARMGARQSKGVRE